MDMRKKHFFRELYVKKNIWSQEENERSVSAWVSFPKVSLAGK